MIGIINKTITKIFGKKSDRDLKDITPQVIKIKEEFAKLENISIDELRSKTVEFKNRIAEHLKDTNEEINSLTKQAEENPELDIHRKEEIYREVDTLKKELNVQTEEILNTILSEAFAVVKETARRFSKNTELRATATQFDRDLVTRRDHMSIQGNEVVYKNTWVAAGNEVTWNMIHYDVQLIGGIVLHTGKIAEMATGEGKTLVATLPLYLNALAGKGVHVVTVNDYLAKRDSEWNGPIFEFLGLSIDCIDKHEPNSVARRNAYNADITYGTNNEFGFDYLRPVLVQ